MIERLCSTCGLRKPLDAEHWYRDRAAPDGWFTRRCKACEAERLRVRRAAFVVSPPAQRDFRVIDRAQPPPVDACPYCARSGDHGSIGVVRGTGDYVHAVACPGPALAALEARIARLERRGEEADWNSLVVGASDPDVRTDIATAVGVEFYEVPEPETEEPVCGIGPGPDGTSCELAPTHRGYHRSARVSWP